MMIGPRRRMMTVTGRGRVPTVLPTLVTGTVPGFVSGTVCGAVFGVVVPVGIVVVEMFGVSNW